MRILRRICLQFCLTKSRVVRGEVNIVDFMCFILIFSLIFAFIAVPKRAPTFLSSVKNYKFDLRDIEEHAINTVLIEQDDGSVFIAFQMSNLSKTVSEIRKGKTSILPLNGNVREKEQEKKNVLEHLSTKKELDKELEDKTKLSNNKESKSNTNKESVKPVVKYPITAFGNPYFINNEHMCKGLDDILFIVLVHSSTTHFMRRSSIRETWANYKLFKKHNMRVIFLLGKPEKDSTQVLIEHESMMSQDIVQGNFVDSYRNLTHKGVMGYRWVSEFCPQAKRIVKVDDDVFLNVFKLMNDFETQFSNRTSQIMCYVRHKGTSLIQRGGGKWKIDDNEFFNMTHYPVTYCNGFFVIVTGDIIAELYKAAAVTPFFWVDDVYLYGLLPDKIGNVTFIPLPNLNLNENAAIKCFESKDKKCQYLVANAHTDGVMDKLWYRTLDHYQDLAQEYAKKGLLL